MYRNIAKNVSILNVGCGNSVLPEEMYDEDNFRNITNIDVSPICIEQMIERNETTRKELKCK